MPRKHLWLSIPSVIFDMLNMCWEGRTVNQPIIAWCPSVKAKGQKVHEKCNFCCNSSSVMCTSSPSPACVIVCSCQRQAFLCVCLEIQMVLYPGIFWAWVTHFAPLFHQSAPTGKSSNTALVWSWGRTAQFCPLSTSGLPGALGCFPLAEFLNQTEPCRFY